MDVLALPAGKVGRECLFYLLQQTGIARLIIWIKECVACLNDSLVGASSVASHGGWIVDVVQRDIQLLAQPLQHIKCCRRLTVNAKVEVVDR